MLNTDTTTSAANGASANLEVSTLWRLKLIAHMCDNVYYLSRRGNIITLQSKSGILHALSNISRDAALFEFALEDAWTAFDAGTAVKKHAAYIKRVEII